MEEEEDKTIDNERQVPGRIEVVLLSAIAASLVFLLHSSHFLNADEGMVLNAAWQMWNGKEMYADFTEYTAPGTPLLIFLLWKLAGEPSYLAAKIFSILFLIFSALGLYLISRRITRNERLALFAVFLWIAASLFYPIINHNPQSSFAAVWTLYFLLRACEVRQKKYFLATGLGAGAVFIFLQTKGFFVLLASLLFTLCFMKGKKAIRIKNAGLIIAGFTLAIFWLFLAWNPLLLLQSLFFLPFQTDYLTHTFRNFYILGLEVLTLSLMTLLALRAKSTAMILLIVFQAGLWLSHANLIDIQHMMINAFPSIVFVLLMLHKWFLEHRTPLHVQYMLAVQFLIFTLVVASFNTPIPWSANIYSIDILGQSRGTTLEMEAVKEARHIFSGPFAPGLYFELKKPNPFPVSNLLICNHTCMEKMLQIFKEVKPEFAFLHYAAVRKFSYNMENPLDLYIRTNYKQCKTQGYTDLLTFARENCPE